MACMIAAPIERTHNFGPRVWFQKALTEFAAATFIFMSRETVEAFHRLGIEAGGKDDGAPAIREDFAEDYSATFLKDPDGQRIEAVCRVSQLGS